MVGVQLTHAILQGRTRGAHIGLLKSLNLSSYGLQGVAILADAASLETLVLSANSLSDISPLAGLPSLRELHLRKNELSLQALAPLEACPALRKLTLQDNPCTEAALYRQQVIAALPNLMELDGQPVDDSERAEAAALCPPTFDTCAGGGGGLACPPTSPGAYGAATRSSRDHHQRGGSSPGGGRRGGGQHRQQRGGSPTPPPAHASIKADWGAGQEQAQGGQAYPASPSAGGGGGGFSIPAQQCYDPAEPPAGGAGAFGGFKVAREAGARPHTSAGFAAASCGKGGHHASPRARPGAGGEALPVRASSPQPPPMSMPLSGSPLPGSTSAALTPGAGQYAYAAVLNLLHLLDPAELRLVAMRAIELSH